MAQKYFTISYDDGLEQDRRIISLMEKYGIKGTFNLSSGLFGKKAYVKRIGDVGYKDVAAPGRNSKNFAEHFALDLDEAVKLYSHPNVEVASHGTHHLHQQKLTKEEAEEEIRKDVQTLSELFGYPVIGHAFPYGSYNENVLQALRESGVRFARKVSMYQKPKDFSFQRNELLLKPSCWHLDPFAEKLLQQFIDTPLGNDDMVFYMWGHGYELDYGSKRGCDAWLEHLFQMVYREKNIACVTNGDLYKMKES